MKIYHGIDLLKSNPDDLATFLSNTRRLSHIVFSDDLKRSYLDSLDPAKFSEDTLRDNYNAFEEADEHGAGPPMLDGLRAVHESLKKVDAANVVLLLIG